MESALPSAITTPTAGLRSARSMAHKRVFTSPGATNSERASSPRSLSPGRVRTAGYGKHRAPTHTIQNGERPASSARRARWTKRHTGGDHVSLNVFCGACPGNRPHGADAVSPARRRGASFGGGGGESSTPNHSCRAPPASPPPSAASTSGQPVGITSNRSCFAMIEAFSWPNRRSIVRICSARDNGALQSFHNL